MSFKKYSNEWILNRFATDINYRCIGVGGKIFSEFIKSYNPTNVISYADLRWTINKDENLYSKIGFKLDEVLKPNYTYINMSHPDKRIHKFNLRKKLIATRYGADTNKTESELTAELGYSRVWDCGLLKYKWTKQN
jgi:hypothetical protein